MDGKVRPARSEDLPGILRVERAAFSTPWSARTFEGLLGHPTTLFRVFEARALSAAGSREAGSGEAARTEGDGAGIVGYAILWWAGDEGELANLAVAPEARRRGVGGRLLDALFAEARLRGVRSVFLEVRASNEAALELYGTRGFEQVGLRKAYYRSPREDARVLGVDLDPESVPLS
jgi:[ribosomal protein S18]-alanine N-acetyltransferase